jgi:hypothetical protein
MWNAGVSREHLRDGLYPENPGGMCDSESSWRGINVAAARSHRVAVDSEISASVDEVSVSHVDE